MALRKLEDLGVVLVDPADLPSIGEMWDSFAPMTRLRYEFKEGIAKYLGGLKGTKLRNLGDLIKCVLRPRSDLSFL